jgi:hypothetical protein
MTTQNFQSSNPASSMLSESSYSPHTGGVNALKKYYWLLQKYDEEGQTAYWASVAAKDAKTRKFWELKNKLASLKYIKVAELILKYVNNR